VRTGDYVTEGQLLGEVVNIEDVDADRTPIIARNSGLIFGIRPHKLAVPGEIGIKIAGSKTLEWRTGNLLTAR
jgi:predicted deacylase